jgi:signal transduction histidine kinase
MNLARIRQWWDRRVEPYQPIPDEDQAGRARLLAGLALLALIIALGLPTVLTLSSPPETQPMQWVVILMCWAGLGLMYHNARKGRTQLPALLIIVGSISAIYLSPAFSPPEVALIGLYYVVEIILFSAMFMSFRFTMTLAFVSLVIMLVLPAVHRSLNLAEVLRGPANFTFFMSVIIALYIRYRLQADDRRRLRLLESEERYRRISEVTSDYAFSYRLEPAGNMVKEWSTDPLPGVPENVALILNSTTEKVRLLDAEESVVLPSNITTLLGGKGGERDYRLREADGGDHWVRVYRYPVWSDREKRITHIYGAVKDVTERKQAEDAARQLKLQQERLTVINHLTEAISHDFRTALASIVTNRYLLERKWSDDPDSQKRLQVIQTMVDHMTVQLDKFKHLAGLVQPNLYPIDLNQLMGAIAAAHQKRAAAANLQLVFEPGVGIPIVRVDSAEIERATGYLLDNAFAYTPAGGAVTLRTRERDQNVLIEVQDTGPGIPEAARSRIYDFFYRADPARSTESGGIGMGLSLVKMVAEAHGGSISVESQVGAGSTFILALPVGTSDVANNDTYFESLAAD